MKNISSFLVTGLVAGSLALGAFSSVAVADDRSSKNNRGEQRMQHRGAPGGFIHLICSDQGAKRLEAVLGKLDERLTLTDEQKPLYDTLKSTALTAQTSFADSCEKRENPKDGKADPVAGMKTRQTNMTANLAAMDEIVPVFEAFYNSLTDEQKADLRPDHDKKDRRGHKKDNKRAPKKG